MKTQQSSLLLFTFALCLNQFVFCEDSIHGIDLIGPDHGAGAGPDDLSRYSRASPLRWGKRSSGQNNILRWGKRGEDSNEEDSELNEIRLAKEEHMQSRPVREAPLRWGKRMSALDLAESDGLEMRHLRASPLRWGKRSFGDDKRAPLRWGKRTPSRFGKREQIEEDEARYEFGPYY